MAVTAAVVDSAGNITPVGGKVANRQRITAEDVKDPAKLAEILTRIQADTESNTKGQRRPYIVFHDVTITAGSTYQFQHNFTGRVHWWVVEYQVVGGSGLQLQNWTATTTEGTLGLYALVSGIVSIRVEPAT
jgi:hypothetical protein